MTDELKGQRIAFVVSNEGIEQAELKTPWDALEAAGAQPVLVARESGRVQAFDHLDRADEFEVDSTTSEVRAEDFDALMLPGGVANGDQVRSDPAAVALVRDFFAAGKPVGVICHGPWVIIEADQVRGRTLTSWPSLATDIRNGGGWWVDQEVQVCTAGPSTIVSSRKPDDLPAFCRTLVEVFARAGAPAH